MNLVDVHTFAALEGPENYDHFKGGFAPVLEEINLLIATGSVEWNGSSLELDIYLGGDYKASAVMNVWLYPILYFISCLVSLGDDVVKPSTFHLCMPLLPCFQG